MYGYLTIRVSVFAALMVFVLDSSLKSLSNSIILNSGISFGFTSGLNVNALWVLVYLVITGLSIWRARQSRLARTSLILVLLAASNFVDRLLFGGVRDYIELSGVVFNLSDVAVNIFLLQVCLYFANEAYTKGKNRS